MHYAYQSWDISLQSPLDAPISLTAEGITESFATSRTLYPRLPETARRANHSLPTCTHSGRWRCTNDGPGVGAATDVGGGGVDDWSASDRRSARVQSSGSTDPVTCHWGPLQNRGQSLHGVAWGQRSSATPKESSAQGYRHGKRWWMVSMVGVWGGGCCCCLRAIMSEWGLSVGRPAPRRLFVCERGAGVVVGEQEEEEEGELRASSLSQRPASRGLLLYGGPGGVGRSRGGGRGACVLCTLPAALPRWLWKYKLK